VGQFPPCYQIPKVSLRPHRIAHGMDTILTPSPRARLGAPALPGPASEAPWSPCPASAAGKGPGAQRPRLLRRCRLTRGSAPAAPGHPGRPARPAPGSGDGSDACVLSPSLLYILAKKIKRHCPINYVSYGAIFFPESPTGSCIRFPGSLASSLATQ